LRTLQKKLYFFNQEWLMDAYTYNYILLQEN